MATTVIIPARNEASTIGGVIRAFNESICECEVFVGIDADTRDNTTEEANRAGATFVIRSTQRGKGQVAWQTLVVASQVCDLSDRIVFCDADYTGLTGDHVYRLIERVHRGMNVGVPDFPTIDVPEHVIMAWPRVSGFRAVPFRIIPEDLHGYLMETQLELAAIKARVPIVRTNMEGLQSPFQWPMTTFRASERERDRLWGVEHGILARPS